MKTRRIAITFDYPGNRWIAQHPKGHYSLHCGDCFHLHINGKYIPARIELGWQWYVILGDTRLDLREQDTYWIKI